MSRQPHHIRFFERDAFSHIDDWAEDLSFNLQYFLHIKEIIVSSKAPYLLTKHGDRMDQNENNLLNRIEHITDFLTAVYYSTVVQQNDEIKKTFGKIAVWHLRRYIYLDSQVLGDSKVYEEVISSKHTSLLLSWFNSALRDWAQYGKRWDEPLCFDYKIMLQYLIDGNHLLFKIRNYCVWKIKYKVRKWLQIW